MFSTFLPPRFEHICYLLIKCVPIPNIYMSGCLISLSSYYPHTYQNIKSILQYIFSLHNFRTRKTTSHRVGDNPTSRLSTNNPQNCALNKTHVVHYR